MRLSMNAQSSMDEVLKTTDSEYAWLKWRETNEMHEMWWNASSVNGEKTENIQSVNTLSTMHNSTMNTIYESNEISIIQITYEITHN